MRSHRPSCTLFPYTTLFRSEALWNRCRHRYARGRLESLGFAQPCDPRATEHQTPVLAASTKREFALKRGLQRSEEHTSELQSHSDLVCRLLLEKTNEIKSGK